jgi:putative FmdB family regulatory protein
LPPLRFDAGLVSFGDFDMPIYEYRCESCGEELEKLQRMSDDKLVDCPACEKPTLKRLVSAAAFRLKGSGWYETDFKKDNKRNLAESVSGSESTKKESSDKKASAGSDKKTGKASSAGSDKKATAKPATKTGKSNAA